MSKILCKSCKNSLNLRPMSENAEQVKVKQWDGYEQSWFPMTGVNCNALGMWIPEVVECSAYVTKIKEESKENS